jgi:TonB family protein
MKYLTLVLITVSAFWSWSDTIQGQTTKPWIEVSRSDEFFRVSMPNKPIEGPLTARYGKIDAKGKVFDSTFEDARYVVWVLNDAHYSSAQDVDEYLDACADLIWDGLLKSARDDLPDIVRAQARMVYVRELPANPLPGREYSFKVGDVTGTTKVFVARSRIYVVLAAHLPGGAWEREKFFSSFVSSATPPMPEQQPYGDPLDSRAPETKTDPNDYNRVFSGREVTVKARVLGRPEPIYTESARKFAIQGTVVLRCVFSKDGEVTNLHVVRKLPHGLTQQAIKAARAIRFTPSMKDGRPVSMYMELQYNFNLF